MYEQLSVGVNEIDLYLYRDELRIAEQRLSRTCVGVFTGFMWLYIKPFGKLLRVW